MRLSVQRLISDLPGHLQERARLLSADCPPRDGSEFVLYWMCTALRLEENPALQAAQCLAERLDLSLLIYHGLSETYRYASDRHHMFILQGARDVQAACRKQGLTLAAYVERRGERPDWLLRLADRAAVVVTEEMPTAPVSLFRNGLASRTQTPLIAVDTACVVPVQLVGRSFERAFQFREHVADELKWRIVQPWPDVQVSASAFPVDQIGFVPLDLQQADLSELISECEIDHAVAPVPDTPGGFQAAERRWNQFLKQGLSGYATKRNNPLQDGVSRMSAYLHYGMISPFRMARDAAAQGGNGGEKFLDELVIWRELAWSFCFHRDDHELWTALPEWARRTLTQHAADQCSGVFTWEQLARGKTGDSLWDTAQQSLLVHGELHNNVRMTWGKAVLKWTDSPQQALRIISDLNNRYALDGRDPSSWGGLLWCLGQFDRPFRPETRILGTVRSRPAEEHARRLNVEEWRGQIRKVRCERPPRCAVIGAGPAGLTAARILQDHLLSVVVFEKSRGVGGRMATRRRHSTGIDHGAPYFQARTEWFRRYVGSWKELGLVQRWQGTFARLCQDGDLQLRQSSSRLVAVPGMNAIGHHLASELDVRTEAEVQRLQRSSAGWIIDRSDGTQEGPFDAVVVAVPGPQVESLLVQSDLLPASLLQLRSCARATLQLGLSQPLAVSWSALESEVGLLQQVIRSQLRPGRSTNLAEELVLHSRPLEDITDLTARQQIWQQLLQQFWTIVDAEIQQPVWEMQHWWRYAEPLQNSAASLSQLRGLEAESLYCCGDWRQPATASICSVEAAFLSGQATAGMILRKLQPQVERTQRSLFASET